jgi:hypothetical protein
MLATRRLNMRSTVKMMSRWLQDDYNTADSYSKCPVDAQVLPYEASYRLLDSCYLSFEDRRMLATRRLNVRSTVKMMSRWLQDGFNTADRYSKCAIRVRISRYKASYISLDSFDRSF